MSGKLGSCAKAELFTEKAARSSNAIIIDSIFILKRIDRLCLSFKISAKLVLVTISKLTSLGRNLIAFQNGVSSCNHGRLLSEHNIIAIHKNAIEICQIMRMQTIEHYGEELAILAKIGVF